MARLFMSVLVLGLLVAQQPILAQEPESLVPPAVQKVRWAMLSADVNSLTFRSMDRIFDTRLVGRMGPVWELPREDHAPNFSYSFDGKTLSAQDALERTYTNALLIIKHGTIVTELYRNRSDPQSHFMSWSMAKSITSLMMGVALKEGRISSLDDEVDRYVPELKSGGYNAVTIRQVLQMRSGVEYEERYDFQNPGVAARNHELALIKNVARFADVAKSVPRAEPPGSHFVYKTLDTAVLGWVLERAVGMPVSAYLASRIWEPLGAEQDGFFIMDGPPGVGREFTGAGYNATLRDYGRLGLMVLDHGSANGHQIVPSEWIEQSTRPTELPNRSDYGFQWWTEPHSQAFYALGLQGQYIYVDPRTQTVVVKLSYFPPGDDAPYQESLAFLRAASAWKP
jgi:CubicO group peptidase (beta-lactamase class C family)